MNYIGMDIHKEFTVAVVKDKKVTKIAEEKFVNSKNNFSEFLSNYPKYDTKIVIESTGAWEYIYDILEEMQYEVKLANPARTRAIAEARIKTDSVDASTLADLLRANLVAESYIPRKEVRRLREIVRERSVFVKQTTQIKNRIHAILVKRGMKISTKTLCKAARLWLREQPDEQGMLKHYLNLLDYYEQELDVLEKEIRSIAATNSDAQLLMTIQGIASIRAMDLLAEIGDIDRFSTGEKLCSYAGLVPSVHQSGFAA